MTKEEFDNYNFSIYTEIRVFPDYDFWDRVTEVNFEDRTVGIQRGQTYRFDEIREIKN